DVFPVHGVGGTLGTVLAGVFASDQLGVFSGQGYAVGMDMIAQVKVQLIGVVAVVAWSAIATYVLLKLVDAITPLRVDGDQETLGLDLSLHDERGYDL
ncbi:MAG: ammonia channel protein, partial [Porticoccaceae bacterium]